MEYTEYLSSPYIYLLQTSSRVIRATRGREQGIQLRGVDQGVRLRGSQRVPRQARGDLGGLTRGSHLSTNCWKLSLSIYKFFIMCEKWQKDHIASNIICTCYSLK